MRTVRPFHHPMLAYFVLATAAIRLAAQSPNTSSLTVVVVDQGEAAVRDAKVSVVNTATGITREAVSDAYGSVTIAALPLTDTPLMSAWIMSGMILVSASMTIADPTETRRSEVLVSKLAMS